MKTLLRLYPRSWRKRYGREMEVLLEDVPGEMGVGLDLVLGAGAAYAAVIRGNRILASAGSFLHGVSVAVLLQAIAFVTFILFGLSSNLAADAWFGPFQLASFERSQLLLHGPVERLMLRNAWAIEWLPAAAILVLLLGALAFLVAAPRLLRTSAR
jgi:hypothetical protein